MPRKKKKEMSWDELGEAFGKKMEKEFKGCEPKPWYFHKERGGGFGRFLFIVGVLYAMHLMGFLVSIPLWVLAIIVIGFSLMRF